MYIINYLNDDAAPFDDALDIDHDGSIIPLDALLVINFLNATPPPAQATIFEPQGFSADAPRTPLKAEVAAAISDLSEPLRLFNLPSEAGCETASANVALVGVGFGQVDDKTENHTREHAEFQADYVLECEEIDLVTSIRFTYFELFPDAQKLDVSLISVEGAFSYTVYRDQPVLALQD